MKYCPLCHNQYTDPTLRFCLQDGTSLVSEVKQSVIDTIAFSNPLTAEKILQTEEMHFIQPDNQNKTEKNKSSFFIWAAVLPAFFVFGAFGVGVWAYLKNQEKSDARSSTNISSSAANSEKNPLADASVEIVSEETKQPQNSNSRQENVSNSEDVKREIAEIVNSWKDAAQAKDLTNFLSKYADTVEYHDKKTSVAQIRDEQQKVFAKYEEIEIFLTNLRIAASADGKNATAVFDKEWTYETGKELSEGKAHTKLHFQKNEGVWKIVSEKNMKVYYTEE